MATSVDEFIARLPGPTREIVLTLRQLTEDAAPDAPQAVKYNALCFFKGARPFVGISPHTNHVSLIFDRGAELTDPAGVLKGGGKFRRHIPVRAESEIADLPVKEYVRRCYALD